MVLVDPAPLLHELVRRGLIQPGYQPLGPGNRDRHPARPRHHGRAVDARGRPLKLTLGHDLGEQVHRHQAIAQDLPDLIPPVAFHVVTAQGEAWAESWVDGESLARHGGEAAPAPAVQLALAHVVGQLAATGRPSTPAARQAEWDHWGQGLLGLPDWSERERALLAETVLPRLGTLLATDPPEQRWSHGDFTADNLLLTPAGKLWLIDCEDAALTHFFAVDAVRFHTMSALARRHPAWIEAIMPSPPLAWQLYFWLRQWQTEQARNSPAYCHHVRPGRLGLIRRWAEALCERPLEGWSTPPLVVHHHPETAQWSAGTGPALTLGGWCHVPAGPGLRSLVVSSLTRRWAEVPPLPRPDVQAHFAGEPGARESGYHFALPPVEPAEPLHLLANLADGTVIPVQRCRPGDLPGRGPTLGDYVSWQKNHVGVSSPAPAGTSPTFSLLLPCYQTPPSWLEACLDSVVAQSWPHWELHVVDDGSSQAAVRDTVTRRARDDARLHLQVNPTNLGIARATNVALRQARGDYIVLLDHDDRLAPGVLAALARYLQEHPETDVVYTDEDKITPAGSPDAPAFKPAFSPEFLRGVMYVGHLLTVRRTLAEQVGGFDPAYDGLQDYEFMLRVSEHTRHIAHRPIVGYHWRQSAGSIALDTDNKGRLDERQAQAVQAHLTRLGQTRRAVPRGHHRVHLMPDPAQVPAITLIYAPAPNALLPWSAAVIAAMGTDGHVRPREIFCPADLAGQLPPGAAQPYAPGTPWPVLARAARGEVVVLLRLTPLALHPGWLLHLAALAALPDAGLVAPVLLSREGRVLESGWTWGRNGAGPLMRGFDFPGDGYNGSLACAREVAALSGHVGAWHRRHSPAAGAPADLLSWSLTLRRDGYPCRVAAAAVVQTGWSWAQREDLPPLPWPQLGRDRLDPYYPAACDAQSGDYRLREEPALITGGDGGCDPPWADPAGGAAPG